LELLILVKRIRFRSDWMNLIMSPHRDHVYFAGINMVFLFQPGFHEMIKGDYPITVPIYPSG
jgi:hypothetical protein